MIQLSFEKQELLCYQSLRTLSKGIRQVNRMYLPSGLPKWEPSWFIHAQVIDAPYELNWDREMKNVVTLMGNIFAVQ